MPPTQRIIANEVIRAADLFTAQEIVEDVTFENCLIVGPAVVHPAAGTEFRNSAFVGDPAAIYWSVEETRQRIIGALVFSRCIFDRCKFENIGIAGPSRDRDQFLRDLS